MGIRTSPRSPWISSFSQIALLYSHILLLVVVPGVLVFHYAWAHGRSYGLFVLTYFPESSFFRHVPGAQAWVVRVESNKKWYLNSQRIEPDDLTETLRAQISGRTSRIVFFDANSDVPYAEAIHAIDLIEQSSGKVVLLTPETKKVRIPRGIKAGLTLRRVIESTWECTASIGYMDDCECQH
jgi:hypothetical protein